MAEIDSIIFYNSKYVLRDTTVADIEGNVYSTVTIGTQTWMTSNLRTTRYNDNTVIPMVTDPGTWNALTSPGYCTYNNTNDSETVKLYGCLYNWYTVNTSKLAPKGWHIPTTKEVDTLIAYLGKTEVAGGKLKMVDTLYWKSPNAGATNESGFSAVPGGCRDGIGKFYGIGEFGYWWTSTGSYSAMGTPIADCYRINYQSSIIYVGVGRLSQNRKYGLSIRCIKD